MKVTALRSDKIYKEILKSPVSNKTELYREKMLQPFKKKWDSQQIPYKSKTPNDFDVIMFNNMAHLAPEHITSETKELIDQISSESVWTECQKTIEGCLNKFIEHEIQLPVSDYLFTILLGNLDNPLLKLSDGYSGDGGIPGYLIGSIIPNTVTLNKLPELFAHEVNHNVRYQFIKWDNQTTLGEMIVSEGLAENFVAILYGEESVGPWVKKTSETTLQSQIKPLLKSKLDLTGFQTIFPYIYGDEVAELYGYRKKGVPYAAGYSCGYHLVKRYLEKTNKSIMEATLLPAEKILNEVQGFWNE